MRFGPRTEQRTLHGDVCAPGVDGLPDPAGALNQAFAQVGAERIGEADMHDDAIAEECGGTSGAGSIDDLIGDDHVTGYDFLLQRPDGRDGEDSLHSESLEGPDVGADRNLMRHQSVSDAVPRQEGDPLAMQRADHDLVRGVAKGRRRIPALDIAEARHLVEARAANHAELCRRRVVRHLGAFPIPGRPGQWAGSVDQHRDDVMRQQSVASVERLELDQEGDGGHIRARLDQELERCLGRASRGEQIIDERDSRAGTQGVGVHFDRR